MGQGDLLVSPRALYLQELFIYWEVYKKSARTLLYTHRPQNIETRSKQVVFLFAKIITQKEIRNTLT